LDEFKEEQEPFEQISNLNNMSFLIYFRIWNGCSLAFDP
jgi:hypothetical protein